MHLRSFFAFGGLVSLGILVGTLGCSSPNSGKSLELLNVSYDPTRELWKELNDQFIPRYQRETGIELDIKMSHGGSAAQARSVIDGLEADVVTLALPSDTDALRKKGLLAEGWEKRLPHDSLFYYSTIVFVVRKGNPRNIKNWPDLVQEGIEIITPNPKTSGNGKLSFLAAWGAVITRGGSEKDAQEFITKLYQRVPVLDSGARGATTTFAQRGIGDVHLTWENEAFFEVKEANGELEVIYPPRSIKAEPRVAVVDANVDRKGTRAAAEAYLKYLDTAEAQEIIARQHYRPINVAVLKKHDNDFPALELFPITSFVKDWEDAQQKFFVDGGVFDKIYQPKGK
jgi:sulfate transport system substrate-binding protein